jgi:hypothetical protein
MEGSLFNSGFLGSKFLWWIGQVADDRTWRDNQDPAKKEDPEKDPAWGYRYKVRIMGLHDKKEDPIKSDNLPWAQVMYSVWGGGLGGSRQTPGIKQGMFVFGFFLDGSDQQVPIIIGILGANAKTKVEKLKTGKDDEEQNFGPQSAWSNSDDDETKVCPDEQVAVVKHSIPTVESSDAVHQETAHDVKKKQVLDKEHALGCCDPQSQSDTKNMQTNMQQLSKDIQALQQAEVKRAQAMGLPVVPRNDEIDRQIKDKTGEMTGPMKGIMDQTQQLVINDYNEDVQEALNLAVPSFKNKLLEENIAALEEISCMFNTLNQGLAGMMGGAIKKSMKKKKEQSSSAVGIGTTVPGNTREKNGVIETFVPIVNDSGEVHGNWVPTSTGQSSVDVPPLPHDGYYNPSPICSTEELLGEVLGTTINTIMNVRSSAKSRLLRTTQNSLAGTDTDVMGTEDTPLVDMSLSEANVAESLKSGALVGAAVGVFAKAAGVDRNVMGRVTNAFKQGQYGYGLETMMNLANVVGTDAGRAAALSRITSGDILGGFMEAAGPLGIDTGMMSNLGNAFSAIQSGDMGSLTGAIQGLAGFDPGVLNAVAGLSAGADSLMGMGSMGGKPVNIAKAMNFVQSVTKIFECDPEQECSPNTEHTLGEGGSGSKDEPNCASIAEKAENARRGGGA